MTVSYVELNAYLEYIKSVRKMHSNIKTNDDILHKLQVNRDFEQEILKPTSAENASSRSTLLAL